MTEADIASIRRVMTPSEPSLGQFDERILLAALRVNRAGEKVIAADAEFDAALTAQADLIREREQFVAANPDPQLAMPL